MKYTISLIEQGLKPNYTFIFTSNNCDTQDKQNKILRNFIAFVEKEFNTNIGLYSIAIDKESIK